jgi:hypothetical protein
MKQCPRCRGQMFTEPFSDAKGSGQSEICMSCGETEDTYLKLASAAMELPTFREMMRPERRGRAARKVAT